jgi:hypothetical protein
MVKMCEQVNGIVALEANITSVTAQQQIKLNDPSTVSGWCYNVCCTVASLGLVSPSAVTDGVTRMDTGSHERSLLSAVHKCWWPFLVITTNHSPRFFSSLISSYPAFVLLPSFSFSTYSLSSLLKHCTTILQAVILVSPPDGVTQCSLQPPSDTTSVVATSVNTGNAISHMEHNIR